MVVEQRRFLYLDFHSGVSSSEPGILEDIGGWHMQVARSVGEARQLIERQGLRIGLVSLEPGTADAIAESIRELGRSSRHVQWIGLVTDSETVCNNGRCANVIAEHFFDYHTLPIDGQRLAATLGHALGMSRAIESAAMEKWTGAQEEEVVGTSPVMLELFRTLRKMAASDAPVFIFGESGTGKELAARAIHERSLRCKGPFVALDCGAIPATLIQSELFGYEKGAFTGAVHRKVGRIEAATGGTLFLDEVGDLPMELQANLLRFLQESTIQRVGGTQHYPVDARVIAATHVNLDGAVRKGTFRQDLLFRLCVLQVTTPPLRDRLGDIELLAKYFLERFGRDSGRALVGFSGQALDAMRAYDWPGNVRELINRVRRAIVMCESRIITPDDLDLGFVLAQGPRAVSLDDARCQAERETIEAALRTSSFNISRTARRLGVSRVTLYRLIEKHSIAFSGMTGSS